LKAKAGELRMFRAKIELGFAVVFAVITAVTLLWPAWIESLFGIAPDHGSGEAEWLLVAVLALAGLLLGLLGRRDYSAAVTLREARESANS
jgi:hypothetical protein